MIFRLMSEKGRNQCCRISTVTSRRRLTSSSRYSASVFLYIKRFLTLAVCFFLPFLPSSSNARAAGIPTPCFGLIVELESDVGFANDVFGIS